MLSTPLNIVSKIKNLPIIRRALGKYSGEIAFLHNGGNQISHFAENTWSYAVHFKGYFGRFIDRMKKFPLGTLAIIFRSEPKTSNKKSNSKGFIESENETLILLVLTGLFIVFLDIRRQRARRRENREANDNNNDNNNDNDNNDHNNQFNQVEIIDIQGGFEDEEDDDGEGIIIDNNRNL